MNIAEKVAYIQGLADGMEIDFATKEGKILNAVLDVLGDIADKLDEIEENAYDIGDELDALSDDLADVEDVIFGEDEDDDDDDFDDDECDCCCHGHGHEAMFTVTCPACGEEITVDESIFETGEMPCPNCGETLEFEFEDEDDEEDDDD